MRGAVISASHNPWTDNGVKLFAPGGRKLHDQEQTNIEIRLQQLLADQSIASSRTQMAFLTLTRSLRGVNRYTELLTVEP